MNEWIRHSDAKIGVTLAFTGALATMTFNLVKDFHQHNLSFVLLAVVVCTLLALAAGLCAWTLTPRVNDRDADPEAINRLFFASISAHFSGKRSDYSDVLSTLTADPAELTRDIAAQVHANAKIATLKARTTKWAIRTTFAAGVAVSLLAFIVSTTKY